MCFGLCDTAHVTHFSGKKQVLEIVALINKQAVNTEFFKGHGIITLNIVEPFKPCFKGLTGTFHLLDGKVFGFFLFGKLNGDHNLLDLSLDNGLLSLL